MSKKNEVAVRRGRPAMFIATAEVAIAKLVGKLGATGTQKHLAEIGIRNGTPKNEPVEVSIPTLCNIAHRHGVELTRGRPVGSGKAEVVAEVKPAKKAKKGKKAVAGKKRGRPAGSKNKVVAEVPEVVAQAAPEAQTEAAVA